MPTSKQALREYIEQPLDSFTWMKKLTEDDILRELKQLRVRPEFKTEPWLHQLVCFYLGLCQPYFLFLLDMGAGKTKILLDLMTQRVREGKIDRAIVTVPNLINLSTWQEAVEEHSDLGCTIVTAEGKEDKWDMLLKPSGKVTIVDYAGLQYALSMKTKEKRKDGKKLIPDPARIRKLSSVYDFFAADESHKAKNRDSLRYRILSSLTREMRFRYSTTGTLFGRDPEDAFAQFLLIDRGETFGSSVGMFREVFYTTGTDAAGFPIKEFDKRMTRDLYRRLQHRSIRYDEDELADLPERHEILVSVPFADEQRDFYYNALDKLIAAEGRFQELDSAFIRTRQIVAGFVQWNDEAGKHRVTFQQNNKLDQLERLILESGDSKIVVAHSYTPSGELITQRLKSMGIKYEWLYGGSKDPVNAVKRFRQDPDCRVFVMNSEAGGTGTDGLQKVARYLIFYESPSSPITRKQVVKRVHRPGQSMRVVIYDLVIKGSVDMRILKLIKEGVDLHKAVVDGVFTPQQLRIL